MSVFEKIKKKTRIFKFTLRGAVDTQVILNKVNLGKNYVFTEVYFDKRIKIVYV